MICKNPIVEPLEARRLLADANPLGVSFGDEALWDEHFDEAVAHAKALGITSMRVWISIEDWDGRPKPSDPLPDYQTEAAKLGIDYTSNNVQALRRIFDLDRAGFHVMATLTPRDGAIPDSAQQVKDTVTYFKNISSGGRTLQQAVDAWEVGNEPDHASYWMVPGVTDKSVRIRHYVDNYLIPAAEVLKAAGETVVSGGVSYSSQDLNLILSELSGKGKLQLIDYAGFHPYGTFDPDTGANQQATNVRNALFVAQQYGKELIASEWNVRGYNAGNADKWARAIDENFRNVMSKSFKSVYYFSMLDNHVARGGTTTARPAGLLQHDSPITDLTGQSWAAYEAWYKTNLIPNQPFYDMFKAWSGSTIPTPPPVQPTGASISGVVWADLNANGSREAGEETLANRTVFIDADADGKIDSGELTAKTNDAGVYTFAKLSPGAYRVARVASGDVFFSKPSSGNYVVQLGTTDQGGFDFGSAPVGTEPPPTPTGRQIHPALPPASVPNVETPPAPGGGRGTISGYLFADTDRSGFYNPNAGDTTRVGWRVYLDLDGNGRMDTNEPKTLTDAQGHFMFWAVAPGTYRIRQTFPAGYRMTTLWTDITLAPNQHVMDLAMGTAQE